MGKRKLVNNLSPSIFVDSKSNMYKAKGVKIMTAYFVCVHTYIYKPKV